MSGNGQQNLVLFSIAIANVAAIFFSLIGHVPVCYAGQPIAALITTLLLAFVGFDVREAEYCMAIIAAHAAPLPKDVAKRIRRFGLTGEHPRLTRASWMIDIATDRTQDSYWEWVTKHEVMVDRLLDQARLQSE